jgi:hypothetical protein
MHVMIRVATFQDLAKEEASGLQQIDVDEMLVRQQDETAKRQEQERLKAQLLLNLGIQRETANDDLF